MFSFNYATFACRAEMTSAVWRLNQRGPPGAPLTIRAENTHTQALKHTQKHRHTNKGSQGIFWAV